MVKKINVIIVLLALITGCSNNQHSDNFNFETTSQSIPFSYEQIEIEGDLGAFQSHITSQEIETGLEIITVIISVDNPAAKYAEAFITLDLSIKG